MSKARTFNIRIPAIGVVPWIAGIVFAKGFWSTFFAIFVPPWGWYLVAERCLQALGWV